MKNKNNEHFGVMIFIVMLTLVFFSALIFSVQGDKTNKTQAQFDELKGRFLELADITHKDEAIIKQDEAIIRKQNDMIQKQTVTMLGLLNRLKGRDQ